MRCLPPCSPRTSLLFWPPDFFTSLLSSTLTAVSASRCSDLRSSFCRRAIAASATPRSSARVPRTLPGSERSENSRASTREMKRWFPSSPCSRSSPDLPSSVSLPFRLCHVPQKMSSTCACAHWLMPPSYGFHWRSFLSVARSSPVGCRRTSSLRRRRGVQSQSWLHTARMLLYPSCHTPGTALGSQHHLLHA